MTFYCWTRSLGCVRRRCCIAVVWWLTPIIDLLGNRGEDPDGGCQRAGNASSSGRVVERCTANDRRECEEAQFPSSVHGYVCCLAGYKVSTDGSCNIHRRGRGAGDIRGRSYYRDSLNRISSTYSAICQGSHGHTPIRSCGVLCCLLSSCVLSDTIRYICRSS